jgi:hypothetical protein
MRRHANREFDPFSTKNGTLAREGQIWQGYSQTISFKKAVLGNSVSRLLTLAVSLPSPARARTGSAAIALRLALSLRLTGGRRG